MLALGSYPKEGEFDFRSRYLRIKLDCTSILFSGENSEEDISQWNGSGKPFNDFALSRFKSCTPYKRLTVKKSRESIIPAVSGIIGSPGTGLSKLLLKVNRQAGDAPAIPLPIFIQLFL